MNEINHMNKGVKQLVLHASLVIATMACAASAHACEVHPESSPSDELAIYHADGTAAINCSVVAVRPGEPVLVGAYSSEKMEAKFIERPYRGRVVGREQFRTSKCEILDEAKLQSQRDTAYFIISEDGKQTAFVPFNHRGVVTLRKCAKLSLDCTELDASSKYSVFVTWKNCLAGSYTTLASQKPGDPERPELDWRFRRFVTYQVVCGVLDSSSHIQILMPPGEVEIAVVSDDQSRRLEAFGENSNGNEVFGNAKLRLSGWPINNGIHRTRAGESTSVKLQEATCLIGKIRHSETTQPDWSDSGLAKAMIFSEDVRYPFGCQFLPGYDIVNRGVDHYYDVLNSDLGKRWREMGGARPIALLQPNGKFMTTPVPTGQYISYVSRPDFKVNRADVDEKEKNVATYMPLIPEAIYETIRQPTVRRLLIDILVMGGYRGDLEIAEDKLASLDEIKRSRGFSDLQQNQLKRVMRLMKERKSLNQIYERGTTKEKATYNQRAAKFMLELQVELVSLGEIIKCEQLTESAKRFRKNWPNDAGTATPTSVREKLQKARVNYLLGETDLQTRHPASVSVETEDPYQEVGNFVFDLPERNWRSNKGEFMPLQRIQNPDFGNLIQRKTDPTTKSSRSEVKWPISHEWNLLQDAKDRGTDEFNQFMADLKQKIENEFDQKIRAQEAKLMLLKTRVEESMAKVKARKLQRDQIVEARIRAIYKENIAKPKSGNY